MSSNLITPAQQVLGRIASIRADNLPYYDLVYAPENKSEWDEWSYQARKSWYEGLASGAGFTISQWRQTPDPTDNPRAVVMAVCWDQAGKEAAIEAGYEF